MTAFESMIEAFSRTGRCESASVAYRHQPIDFCSVDFSTHSKKMRALTHLQLLPLFVNFRDQLGSTSHKSNEFQINVVNQ